MPDTVLYLVNKLACNEPNQFIFTDRRCCPIGDINIIGVYRYSADSNKKQAQQDLPHDLQATEEADEEPVIPYPKIHLNINHETPKEQVQTPK